MSHTRRHPKPRHDPRVCWPDCFVCLRRAGLTTGCARERMEKKRRARLEVGKGLRNGNPSPILCT